MDLSANLTSQFRTLLVELDQGLIETSLRVVAVKRLEPADETVQLGVRLLRHVPVIQGRKL